MVAAALIVVGLGVGSPAPVSAAEPALALSVSAGLLDGHDVVVDGSGFEPDDRVVVAQCWGPEVNDCDTPDPGAGGSWTSFDIVRVAGGGTLRARVQARRVGPRAGGSSCLVVACSVRAYAVVPPPTGQPPWLIIGPRLADVAISFSPTGTYEFPTPTLAVATGADGASDARPLQLDGEGFSPYFGASGLGAIAEGEVCRDVEGPDPTQDCILGSQLLFYSEFYVYVLDRLRGIVNDSIRPPVRAQRYIALPSGEVDCAIAGCTFALTQGGNPVSPRAPLSWAPEWRPWPSARAFIDAVLKGMAERPATTREVAAYTTRLTTRDLTNAEAALAVARSTEVDRGIGEIVRLYRAYFGRRPDSYGLQWWVFQLRSGRATVSSIARAFETTREFRDQYDALTNEQVVDLVYERTLGRAPDAEGRAYWIGRLDGGLTRPALVRLFSGSSELRARTRHDVEVVALFFGLTGGGPDQFGIYDSTELARALLGSDSLWERVTRSRP